MTPEPLTFDELAHRYHLHGHPVFSVTQLLKICGMTDWSKIPPTTLEAARERGSIVHRAIHFWNENDLDVAQFAATFPHFVGYLHSWIALVHTGRLRTVLCEHRVGNESPRFAGTFDWLGLVDGHAALLDFSTGNPDDAAKHLQTAGYVLASRAWGTMPGETVLRDFHAAHPYVERYSVRLNRDGALPELTPYRDPRDFSAFLMIAACVNAVSAWRRHIRASADDPSWDWSHERTEVAS